VSTTDHWMTKIKCPKCGKLAEAEAFEHDGPTFLRDSSTYIHGDVSGFRVVRSISQTVVHCDDCQTVVFQSWH
jgi:ribosomal protein S27E